jgi:hypothetical protein
MTASDQIVPGRRQETRTDVPFGLSTVAPLRAIADHDAFSLELRDANDAPILKVALDTDNGDIWIYSPGAKIADSGLIEFITERNRVVVIAHVLAPKVGVDGRQND